MKDKLEVEKFLSKMADLYDEYTSGQISSSDAELEISKTISEYDEV